MVFEKWDGVPVEDSVIEEWVFRGIDYLRGHRDENIYCISSGDCTVVFSASRNANPDEDRYTVRVCRVESSIWGATAAEILGQLLT